MTEAEWFACSDVQQMLTYLVGKTDNRALRLFACACCRQVWDLLGDERSRQAVTITEEYAKGRASADALDHAAKMAWEARPHRHRGAIGLVTTPREFAAEAAHATAYGIEGSGGDHVPGNVRRPDPLKSLREFQPAAVTRYVVQARPATAAHQPALLRHLVGNPFRPYRVPQGWPVMVVQLTHLLFAGEEVSGPLADALEEAGHPTLAAHFREDRSHPTGCWVIELILKQGKRSRNGGTPAETGA